MKIVLWTLSREKILMDVHDELYEFRLPVRGHVSVEMEDATPDVSFNYRSFVRSHLVDKTYAARVYLERPRDAGRPRPPQETAKK